MNSKKVKVSFNTLVKVNYKIRSEEPFSEIWEVIKFVSKIRSKKDRQMDLKENKFMRLESVKLYDSKGIVTGFFKSAKYTYRPNLLDRNTGEERASPKKLSEGEAEKTHFAIKKTKDEIFILVEINGNGTTINQIVDYFNNASKHYITSMKRKKTFSLKFYKMGKDDFKEEIKKMQRIRIATVYYDKKLLGNQYLNFSDRISPIQQEIELTVKAEKGMDIKEPLIDIANRFSSKENLKSRNIKKVRIEGKDENGTSTIIDTSFIEKVDNANLSLNPTTGQVETTDAYSNLIAFISPL